MLAMVIVGTASAQVAGSFSTDTSAFRSNPVATHMAISAGSLTNSVLADPRINEYVTYDVGPMFRESLDPSREPRSSAAMAVDRGADGSFVEPDAIQTRRDVLFHKLDLFVRANARSSPVYFGLDSEIRFVEHHDFQPGIPLPVGMYYSTPRKRWTFFTEFAPIIDTGSITSLGWGGGIGIRFYFGR